MTKNIIKFVVPLIVFLSPIFFFPWDANGSKKTNTQDIQTMENRFFTLDFKNNFYAMSDLEHHFFTTFPHDDPTRGDIVYDRNQWVNKDIIKLVKGEGVYLYIKDRNGDTRYDSFRITTKAYYNLNEENQRILFVFKGKLPSAKGIWPAWWLDGSKQDTWTYKNLGAVATNTDLDKLSGKGHFFDTPSAVNGTDWPSAGEVDIIETINGETLIYNTIHTCPQMCDSKWNDDGKTINCANTGCSGSPYSVQSPEGTFACLWEKSTIKFFYWTPDQDVRDNGGPLSEKPVPGQWGGDVLKNEVRLLETETKSNSEKRKGWQLRSCASSNRCVFMNMKMIFNATLCGTWAGYGFDKSHNALQNCRSYIFGKGKDIIDNQFLKIEYVSVSKI